MKKNPSKNSKKINKKEKTKTTAKKRLKINIENTKTNKKEIDSKKEIVKKLLFKTGQYVTWMDKTGTTKTGVILEIKKRIKVEFSDGTISWVGQGNITLLKNPKPLEKKSTKKSVSPKKKNVTTNENKKIKKLEKITLELQNKLYESVEEKDKELAYHVKIEKLEKVILELQDRLQESVEERDKARAYRIDMENEKNEMREEINQLKNKLEDKDKELQQKLDGKDKIIKSYQLEIKNYKQRLQEQIRKASKSEHENKTLLQERDTFKEELSQTKEELDYTSQMKKFNQSEKISLQDKIADSTKQKIYISSDSASARKREEDIAAGLPVSNNIEVVDVFALQQTLINAAKEKYKDNAYIKVLKDTMKRREENNKSNS